MPRSQFIVRTVLLLTAAAVLGGCGGAQVRKLHFMGRGRQFMAQGQYQMARVEFHNALQIAPKDPDVRYFNGLVSEKLGDIRAAGQLYQAAIDVAPDDVPARVHLARLYFLYGDPKQALAILQPSFAKHPNDPRILTIRAGARSRLNDPGALADAQQAYKLAPRSEDTIAILAGIYLKAGRKDDARTLLEHGIADIPATTSLRLALAEQFQEAKDFTKAEALLRQLIALQPKDPAHRIQLAHFYTLSNRLDDAESVLRDGVKALPESSQMRGALIGFLHARRSAGAAEDELRSLIAARPHDADLHFELAALYTAEGKFQQAETEYRTVIGSQQDSPAALEAKDDLAGVRIRQNDATGAESLIAQVLSKDPNDSASLRMRAGIELAHGDAKSAISDLRAVLRDRPDSIPDLRMLAAAQSASGEWTLAQQTLRQAMEADPGDSSAALELIDLLNRRGQHADALQVAEPLVRAHPKDPVVLTAAFRSELAARDLEAARSTAAALRGAEPKDPLGYYFSGLAADASGQAASAIHYYHQALAIAPTAREPLEALTRLYARQGKTAQALEELDALARSQPHDAIPSVLAGELQLALKRLPDASKSFSAAIAIDPSWMPPYRGLAKAELAQKDVDGAIRTLEGARGKVRPSETPELDLASLYRTLGRTNDALDAYRRALQANPRSDEAANDLALLLAGSGATAASLDQALQLAERFSDSPNPYYLDTLGWIHFERGEFPSAVSTLGRAVNLAPDAAVLRYHLAMAELKSGQTAAARDNLQQALKGGKPFDGSVEARSVLTHLQASPPATATTVSRSE